MSTRRIAIVGAGPKGLYCLERLAEELRNSSESAPIEVHIFEPHPFPGAGPVYDPTQPDYLRMNFANEKIDMWTRHRDNADGRDPSRLTFVEYLAARNMAAAGAGYAPRGVVGSYLHDGFLQVVGLLRSVASVVVHRESVQSIARNTAAFEVTTSAQSVCCDEVLIATGHGSRRSPSSVGISPYPIDQPGGVGDIAPRSTVAVRGLGLTAIDVALALTEGRGGRFHAGAVPGQLTYEPAGLEPRSILLHSRTGRPMMPKPGVVGLLDNEEVAAACHQGSESLAAIGQAGTGSVFSVLVATSAAVLRHATGRDDSEAVTRRHLQTLLSRQPVGQNEPIPAMVAAVDIAYGRRTPDADWALGMAWRGIYPALVDLVATRCLDVCWSAFAALATEMERVAFGPPAENAARLLALADAGILDMSCAANPHISSGEDGTCHLQAGAVRRRCDAMVDAVLDPPGAAPHPAPLVASLLAAGLARTAPHCAGLEINADGTCIGKDGAPTPGLAAIGRPTEGSVLGNDTLSRRLHDTPSLWAQAAVQRLGLQRESSAA